MTEFTPLLDADEAARRQAIQHDPFSLMPDDFGDRPSILATPRHLARCRQRIADGPWHQRALDRLIHNADAYTHAGAGDLPTSPAELDGYQAYLDLLHHAQRNALIGALTYDEARQTRALNALRITLRGYVHHLQGESLRVANNDVAEMYFAYHMARTIDLVHAAGVDADDQILFDDATEIALSLCDAVEHRTCNNHNTISCLARAALAIVRREPQTLHDALYGCERNGQWRYGFVHFLRHDILGDGVWWERTTGYHYLTMFLLTEFAWMMGNIGVNVWERSFPSMPGNEDGGDLHDDYSPLGEKPFQAIYDAPLYWQAPNGELPQVGDSPVQRFEDIWKWGPIYDIAHQIYGERRYAHAINLIEEAFPVEERTYPRLPMGLQSESPIPFAEYDFVRVLREHLESGEFDIDQSTDISLSLRHRNGCSSFDSAGFTILRGPTETIDPQTPAAMMYWAPHVAGHQSPAALHVELFAAGNRLTNAPTSAGYDDPLHLDWVRSTIAHNTVTVGRRPMKPYHKPTESIWEAQRFHEGSTVGRMDYLQTQGDTRVMRASNVNVYPGVLLDRTFILVEGGAIDCFRVIADVDEEDPVDMDFAIHTRGLLNVTPDEPGRWVPAAGAWPDEPGYRHFTGRRRLSELQYTTSLTCSNDTAPAAPSAGSWRMSILPPPSATIFAVNDPASPTDVPSGASSVAPSDAPSDAMPPDTLIIHTRAVQAAFIVVYNFDEANNDEKNKAKHRAKHDRLTIHELEGDPDELMRLHMADGGVWRLPFDKTHVTRS